MWVLMLSYYMLDSLLVDRVATHGRKGSYVLMASIIHPVHCLLWL
jgi:hypothetical protein